MKRDGSSVRFFSTALAVAVVACFCPPSEAAESSIRNDTPEPARLHSANHPAKAHLHPSSRNEWRRILSHPSHRHGMCTFTHVGLSKAGECTVDGCAAYPSRFAAEMACANLGTRRCSGVVSAPCVNNPEYATACGEIHASGAKADAQIFVTFQNGLPQPHVHVMPPHSDVSVHNMACNNPLDVACTWGGEQRGKFLGGCIWDKCHTYETLEMAKLFCEVHSHSCSGVTHVAALGGYQARASREPKDSSADETSWVMDCPDLLNGVGDAGGQRRRGSHFLPIQMQLAVLQHRSGRPFIRGAGRDGDLIHPVHEPVGSRTIASDSLVSDSMVEIKVSLVAVTVLISVCGIVMLVAFIAFRRQGLKK